MDISKLTEKINSLFSPELKIELKKAIEETKEVKAEETAAKTTDKSGEVYNEAKLKDGTVIKYTGELAVGSKVIVVTAEGEVPAPEGEHELESGEILVVVKEGDNSVISEIKAATTDDELKTNLRKEILNELELRLKSIEDKHIETINSLKKDNEKLALKLSKTTASVHTVAIALGEIVKMPTIDPIEKPDNNEVSMSKKERAIKNLTSK